MDTRTWLETLVAIDTTSRNSNLALIETVRDWLGRQGVQAWLAHNPERTKANLFATLPASDGAEQGGIVLSGHTDVVPVDGQDWSADPFALREQEGRLYGRGSCDMKGFIAASLALVPAFLEMPRKKPIHLAFSYDEEVGCAGAPVMLADLRERGIQPEGCVVGEPTGMQVVVAHKGINLFRCRVHGKAAHSSLTPRGCNAIEYAARLICRIRDLADAYKANGPYDEFYDVPFSTMTTNQIHGGIAVNTIPELCEFSYEFRNLPGMPADAIQAEVERYVRDELLPRMRAEYTQARIDIETGAAAPGLEASEQAAITQLVRSLTADRVTRKVAYGTEAGLFQGIGIPTVVCGPGHIEQAHKPDEYVALDQLAACEAFLRRLGQSL
ncbi:acetylornithine deacetylase [Bordetella bronchiseptica]|uniref:acetylornithine deacetylase n=1 Tax=Bordetella bronchiseptica TaxID=518 RepID=UPI00028A6B06|nr:acetylornithine deacetylase [Bordetella bronchiseptica]AWQ06579.1 acetylornithine deacetylase [Bordetella bronchiseptica]AZW32118.1 acetylornithine deacetylase [Bordetella bronchiseptica]KAK75162.1 acetylornithine deacetylase ArgE [Bordetella bronchiseptica MO211]KCV45098.1 acetylornithine deacetylase ArgE [Bordetella bronchiseptica 345]KDC13599.1 acetylornithine deacetylase ArgE [Bordetella bronchiseptica F-1]